MRRVVVWLLRQWLRDRAVVRAYAGLAVPVVRP